jgi:gamma-glutamyltranspeptidase/glutathione hydrolase
MGALTCALLLPVLFALASAPASAQSTQYLYQPTIHVPVPAAPGQGMVACQNQVACAVGAQILKDGGNAVDAAVATAFALAVTLPRAGNIGGGGFMLVYLKEQQRVVTIDYREMAPDAIKLAQYLDKDGSVNDHGNRGYLASGVPGTVAGLWMAHEKFGRLPWSKVVQPAAALASKGITLSWGQALSLNWVKTQGRLVRSSAAPAVFERKDGRPWRAGDRLVQPDLAWSLGQIRDHGAKAFYEGEIAQRLAKGMSEHGGLITEKDLARYRAVPADPVTGTYRGYQVVTMPPPSGGGSSVIEMLNILEHFDLKAFGANSARTLHYEAEATKLAWKDRMRYAGDPAFSKVPTDGLVSKDYAAVRAKLISPQRSLPAPQLEAGNPWQFETGETTQISVIDADGNAVSNTFTLGSDFGSGVMIEGTGFMLGNLIGNFSIRAQAEAHRNNTKVIINNILGPGRRPVSSMSPTMLFKDGKLHMVTGSPGGNSIPGTVMQMIVNTVDFGMNIAQATHTPRINQQIRNGKLDMEPEVSPDTIRLLEKWGHVTNIGSEIGCTQTLMVDPDGNVMGAADPRRPGSAAVSPQ